MKGGARFGIGHVVDWDHGNGFSTLAPSQIEDRLERVVKRKLAEMTDMIGAVQSTHLVSFKTPRLGLSELLRGWQPDLIILDCRQAFGLGQDMSPKALGWTCEIQIVDLPGSGFQPGLLFQTLAQSLQNRLTAMP